MAEQAKLQGCAALECIKEQEPNNGCVHSTGKFFGCLSAVFYDCKQHIAYEGKLYFIPLLLSAVT